MGRDLENRVEGEVRKGVEITDGVSVSGKVSIDYH